MHIPVQTQIISLIGAFACLIAYIGHQLHWIDSRKVLYSLLNVMGSGILAYVAFHPFQAGFLLMETIWGITSLYGLYKAIAYKNKIISGSR